MLKNKIVLYVPSTVNGNEPAPAELVAKWVKAGKKKMTELFGGFSCTKTEGGWYSKEKDEIIEEDVTTIASFTDDEGLRHVPALKAFAAEMAREMTQEAVSVEWAGQLEFVVA